MVADIGIIIAAYVIFRAVQALLQTAPGGSSANLHPGAQWGLAVAAAALCVVAVIFGYDILQSSQKASESLSALSATTRALFPAP